MIPRSLVLLAAVGFASTSRVESQSPKRELFEGNYAHQKGQELAKDVSPGIVYAKDYSEDLQELPPGHEIFGARNPQISTISDLLAGAGTPFELAVAHHLSSPVSIYQTRLASPPFKLVSQQPLQGSLAYTTQKVADKIRNLQKPNNQPDLPNSAENELPQTPFTKLDFIAITRQNSDLGRPRGFSLQNTETPSTRVKPAYKKPLRQQFFPIEPQGPFKRPGQFIPAQYLQHQSIYQLVPVPQAPIYQEQGKLAQLVQDTTPNVQLKSATNENLQSQNTGPVQQQGYHNHPNGAISFASFAHNLQTQQSNLPPQQIQRQPVNYITLNSAQPERQEQPHLPNYNQQLQNYQPQFPANYFQYIPQNEPQPELLSSQPSLSFQPRYLNQPQLFLSPGFPQFQAFKPLPQSILPNIHEDTSQKRLPEQNLALNPQNTNQDSVSHQTSTVSERSITHTKSIQPIGYTGFLPTTLKPNEAKTNKVLTSTINYIEKPKEEQPSQLSDGDQLLRVQPLVRSTVAAQNDSTPHVTPRHLVTIQKQELKEITLPTFRPLKYARVLQAQDLIQHNFPKGIKQDNLLKANEHNTHKYEKNTQLTDANSTQSIDDRQNSSQIEKDFKNSQTKENLQQHDSTSVNLQILQDTNSKVKPIQLLYKLLQEKEILGQNSPQDAEPSNQQPSVQESLRESPQFFTQSQALSQDQIHKEQLPQQLLSQQQLSHQELPPQLPQSEVPQHELLHQELPQQEFSSFGLPEYQSVQYFGKYAQSLFGDYPR